MKVLFVCTGNICRSPIAQRMLEDLALQRGLAISVSSAGTRALNGMPMHPESQRVLRENGIVPGEFWSRMLTPAIVADSDFILGMSREHRAFSRQLVPARWKRMYALREIAMSPAVVPVESRMGSRAVGPTDAGLDIADPIRKSAAEFDAVAHQIAISVHASMSWISEQYTVGLGNGHQPNEGAPPCE